MCAHRKLMTLTLLVALTATPTFAQPTPGNDRPANSTQLKELNPSPVKRTWDFTRTSGIPCYSSADGCSDSPRSFDDFISAYNNKVDQFLKGPIDPKKLNLERKNYLKQVLGI